MALVLDASVAIAWFVRKQATAYTDRIRLLEARAFACSSGVELEVANALIMLERRGNVSAKAAGTAAELLGDLVVTVHADRLGIAELLNFAGTHGLSAYDASYLDLALSLRLPLACRDGPLQRALSAAGVRLAR